MATAAREKQRMEAAAAAAEAASKGGGGGGGGGGTRALRLLHIHTFLFLLLLLHIHASASASASAPSPSFSAFGSSWYLPGHRHNLTVLSSPNLSFSLILSWNLRVPSACSLSILHSATAAAAAAATTAAAAAAFSDASAALSCRLYLHPNGTLSLSLNHSLIWQSPPSPLHGFPIAMELRDDGDLVLIRDPAFPSLLRRRSLRLRREQDFETHRLLSRSMMEEEAAAPPTTPLEGDKKDIAATSQGGGGRSTKVLAMEIVFPLAAALVLASLLLLACMRQRRRRSEWERKHKEGAAQRHALEDEALFENLAARLPPRFSYAEIVAATGGFQKKLGEGAYGVVYQGTLPDSSSSSSLSGTAIAVKVFTDTTTMACRKGFCSEVISIGQKDHPNLVSILGFCAEDEHRMLVYELMANGSLNKVLFRPRKSHGEEEEAAAEAAESEEMVVVDWERRRAIAIDTARALAFLHAGDESSRIIHCDVKPENILLNQRWEAKVSDFGLAKLMASAGQDHHDDDDADGDGNGDGNLDGTLIPPSHGLENANHHHNHNNNNNNNNDPMVSGIKGIRGTFGYLAPEWVRPDCTFDTISPASDVYSFGIVLLELVAGRRSILPGLPFLPGLAFDLLAHGQDFGQLVDPNIPSSSLDPSQVRGLVSIALWCIQEDLSLRPSMAKVLDMLTSCTLVPTPPVCNYFIGSSHFFDENGHPSIPRGSTSSFPTFSTSNPSNTSSNSTLSWQVSILSGR